MNSEHEAGDTPAQETLELQRLQEACAKIQIPEDRIKEFYYFVENPPESIKTAEELDKAHGVLSEIRSRRDRCVGFLIAIYKLQAQAYKLWEIAQDILSDNPSVKRHRDAATRLNAIIVRAEVVYDTVRDIDTLADQIVHYIKNLDASKYTIDKKLDAAKFLCRHE